MSPLIKAKEKKVSTRIRIELEEDVLEELKLYQECIGEEDTDYVIEEAIKKLFKAKPFRDWKKQRNESIKEESKEITDGGNSLDYDNKLNINEA